VAIGVGSVHVGEVMRNATVTIHVRGERALRIRLAIAKPLFILAARIAGFGEVRFENDVEEA